MSTTGQNSAGLEGRAGSHNLVAKLASRLARFVVKTSSPLYLFWLPEQSRYLLGICNGVPGTEIGTTGITYGPKFAVNLAGTAKNTIIYVNTSAAGSAASWTALSD